MNRVLAVKEVPLIISNKKSQVQDSKTTLIMSTIYNLHFKWTVSRGRDTYGYNICTLYVDGNKVGKCLGGGYDMQGTSFAQWIQYAFQHELLAKLENKTVILKSRHFNSDKGRTSYFPIEGFYGAELKEVTSTDGKTQKAILLDGACGFDSIRRIAEAIGIKLQWNQESDRCKNHDFYTAIIN